MNGIEKYVKETTQTAEDEMSIGKLVVKSRLRTKSKVTLTAVSVPPRERKCVDVNPKSYDHECYVTSEAMIRLPATDGAVKYEHIVEEFNKKKRKKFDGASQWSRNDWISILAKGGAKNKFQYCLSPKSSRHISYFRAIQRHSGCLAIDPELQDNVLLPKGFTENIYHVGNVSEVHSTLRSGFILGGQCLKRGRQSVFFTTVNPMEDEKTVWRKLHAT